jgi:DNA-binding LacI/PurR family transcriptional regulator
MPDISRPLKKVVREKAAEMGYIPSMSARQLRTGKTKTIAIVYDQYINPYYSIVTDFLHKKLYANNYSLIIFTDSNKERSLSADVARDILSRDVDGIISFLDVGADIKKNIDMCGVYLLLLGRNSGSGDTIDSITTDDVTGGYIATKYLLDCGHRNILMLSGPLGVSCFDQRLKGFVTAMNERGITDLTKNILVLGEDGDEADELLSKVKDGFDFTAIFCYNDFLAYAVIFELEKMGLKVPSDVSVIGYDYVESHFPLAVGLASVDTGKEYTADIAAEVMLLKMKNIDEKKAYKMQTPRLVKGKTVAPVFKARQ